VWSSSIFLFSSFNWPFSKLHAKLNFSKTHEKLSESQRPWWALGLLHFLLFPHDCFRLQQERNSFLFMSLSEIKDGLQVKTGIVKAVLKTIFFTSLSLQRLRDCVPYQKSPVKGPFIAVPYERSMPVMNPIWRPTRSFEYPINSGFKTNKFIALCSQSKNK